MSKIHKIHKGIVKNGVFIPNDKLAHSLCLYRFENKIIIAHYKSEEKQRSNNQNSYYWSVVIELLRDHCGYEAEEMHEALRWKFLRVRRDDFEMAKSTKNLSTVEMEEYLSQCRRLASEMGCFIPLPNEVVF